MSRIKFFFNHECVPVEADEHSLQQAFEKVLVAYDGIYTKNDQMVIKGIITEKVPSELRLTHGKSVGEMIEDISSAALRTLAFAYFSKYPIENHLNWEALFEEAEKYEVSIGDQKYSAMFSYMVAKEQHFSYTNPCHDDLKKNTIVLTNKAEAEGPSISLESLFGDQSNIQWVQDKIDHRAASFEDNWGKLKMLLGQVVSSNTFEKDFKALSGGEQESILRKFEDAKKRNLNTPFSPDTKIIKEVSADDKRQKVCELRVYQPVALRVYFYEGTHKVFLASIEKKSNADQNSDIKKAQRKIENLILTNP